MRVFDHFFDRECSSRFRSLDSFGGKTATLQRLLGCLAGTLWQSMRSWILEGTSLFKLHTCVWVWRIFRGMSSMACRRRKRPLGCSEKVLRLSWQLHSEQLTIAFACAKMPTSHAGATYYMHSCHRACKGGIWWHPVTTTKSAKAFNLHIWHNIYLYIHSLSYYMFNLLDCWTITLWWSISILFTFPSSLPKKNTLSRPAHQSEKLQVTHVDHPNFTVCGPKLFSLRGPGGK